MIQPFGKNILIERIVEEKKSGALFLKMKATDPYKAFVLAKGFKVEEVNIGNVVIVLPYAGTVIEDKGKEYVLIKEDDILGEYLDK